MQIRGTCHCGNISFALKWEPEPAEIVARACSCSFCTRHGGVWAANPAGVLVIAVAQPWAVSQYSFGTQTAVFHICSRCGVVPVVTSRITDRAYAMVNVNTFDVNDRSRVRQVPTTFEAESEGERLARRKKQWIGNVSFDVGALI